MKPKIPKLSKKERHIWIKALRKLLDWYKGKIEILAGCPLCKVTERTCIVGYHCPWFWFTDYHCHSFVRKENFNLSIGWLRRNRNPRWVKLRLRQIPRWIKKLEED